MRYQFVVKGAVPDDVIADHPELSHVDYPTGGTALFGPVRDEADVATLLALLLDRGLSVVDLRPLPD